MTITTGSKLYKIDSSGRTRVWWCEIEDDKIRNVAGLVDGEKVISAWKQMKVKNVGKANQTTTTQQAVAEVQSLYDKKLAQGGYNYELSEATDSKYIMPMLASPYKDSLPLNFIQQIYSQPKLDGMRCIATKDGLFTRKGKRWVSVPHISMELFEMFRDHPDYILDGELYNHDLHDDFDKISSLLRKSKPERQHLEESARVVEYHVYDVLNDAPYSQRRQFLIELFSQYHFDKIRLLPSELVTNQERVDLLYGAYLLANYEGQILRYEREYVRDGRHKTLMVKRKEFTDQEYQLVDLVEGEGNFSGCAASAVFMLEDGRTSDAGIKGNKSFLANILNNKATYIGGEVTVRYANLTPSGKPRFAKVIDFHPEKRQD